MTLTITHAKINDIADWTQADLDAQIALGFYPSGTVLADITLPSDWNANHSISGTLDPDQNNVAVDGVTITGDGTTGNPLVASVSGGSSANTSTITQAAHGFAVADVVYLNGTTYTKAIASAVITAEAVGVVSTVTDANTFSLTTSGKITGLSGLTAGEVYFLSGSVAGGLTATEPSTVGHVSKPVLVAYSTTAGIVINYRGKLISSITTPAVYTGIGLSKMLGMGATL